LISSVRAQWDGIAGNSGEAAFIEWLESAVPGPQDYKLETGQALQTLDSIDGVVLPAVVESDEYPVRDDTKNDLEQALTAIWGRTYARFAAEEEERLGEYFVRRGTALARRVYPDEVMRRRLYSTSMTPVTGLGMISKLGSVVEVLKRGCSYAGWSVQERFSYVADVVDSVTSMEPKFAIREKIGNAKIQWRSILQWWLDPANAVDQPGPARVGAWYDFVSTQFLYRFNWALGGVLGLLYRDA